MRGRLIVYHAYTQPYVETYAQPYLHTPSSPRPPRPQPNRAWPQGRGPPPPTAAPTAALRPQRLAVGGVGPRPSRHWGRPAVSLGCPRWRWGGRSRARVIGWARVIGGNVIRVAHVIGVDLVDLDLDCSAGANHEPIGVCLRVCLHRPRHAEPDDVACTPSPTTLEAESRDGYFHGQ